MDKMSETSIAKTERSKSKARSVISEKRSLVRRYSEINIMMLEGHKNVSAEEEKSKLIKKREEMYQIFKKKYILDDQGQLRNGIAKKKFDGGVEYIG